MGYSKNLMSGFSWQTALKFVSAGFAVVKLFILARILNPADFGLFSLGMITLGLTEAFTQTGVNLTIISSKHSVKYYLDTAWVVAIIRGALIGILMIILGLGLSIYFQDQNLLWLVTILSLVPVVKGFINPAIVSLQKELKFFADSVYRLGLVIGEVLFSVILVFLFKSVYALGIALIFNAVFEVLISFIFFRDHPKFRYIKSRGKEILSQAKGLSISSLFSYLNENLDNLIIGKLHGNYKLGLYQNAYASGHKVNLDFARSWYHSSFPIFSKLKSEHKRLIRAFVRSGGVLLIIMSLGSIPVFLFPRFFVSLLLGQQWLEAVPLLRWLVLAGLIQGISNMFYSLFMAKQWITQVNLHLILSVILMAVLIVVMSNIWGLTGAAAAIFVSRVLALPVLSWSYYRLVKSNN
jgi:lipopolysaccharide exporter